MDSRLPLRLHERLSRGRHPIEVSRNFPWLAGMHRSWREGEIADKSRGSIIRFQLGHERKSCVCDVGWMMVCRAGLKVYADGGNRIRNGRYFFTIDSWRPNLKSIRFLIGCRNNDQILVLRFAVRISSTNS